jgi:chitinase
MPPIPTDAAALPRLITYYQTHHDADTGKPISVLPLLTQPGIALTHLIVAAIHLNDDPEALTLNDHSPSHPRFQTLWAELRVLQASGIRVMGMLGGAAKGSYQRLDGNEAQFERFYAPLQRLIRERGLDGLDLDVEEEMSLAGIVRLIDRLRHDFGPAFIITLAPVAAALIDVKANLSGFSYDALEAMRGRDIAWYNAQFYCGWGDCTDTRMYEYIIARGWPAAKVVIGLVTNPGNGSGYVPWELLATVLMDLGQRFVSSSGTGAFGGIMGWEYFNGLPGDKQKPWEWAQTMTALVRGHALEQPQATQDATLQKALDNDEIDVDDPSGAAANVPGQFDYYSDELDEE